MGEHAAGLMRHMGDGSGYDLAWQDVREAQVAAMNERLQERIDAVKLVGFRAREAGVTKIERLEDVVPLLLPHTAYKSYPESFLSQKRWDRLTKWLGTVSPYPVDDVDLEGIDDIDEWIERLAQAGHYVSCSSGTTGKSAMLVGSLTDMEWSSRDAVAACAWGSGIAPARDRLVFGLAPVAAVPRNHFIGQALFAAFGIEGSERFTYPVPPITIGSITRMVTLRKAMADGTAMPDDLAEFERVSAERQAAMDAASGIAAEALIAARGEKLYVSGMWAALHAVAGEVRKRGYSGADFHPENTCYIGGGLKGAQLPGDYREFIFDTFNLKPERNFQMYGMQEIGTAMPRCREGGRYHVPPWLVCLPLDRDGETLLPMGQGPVEGRAAFFDLSLDGRWGGVISGDHIEIDFSPCACGAHSPSIRDNVTRIKDLAGDDKISCSGTVDAYVRGVA
ncbi:hypothetical protein [Novosphingobium album (ex Liu et al. 2023)]|uniref:Acyl-protein synthetase LuxE domain-containing protein n=1 Tax=Novosphingobium album (ex Liu et al. 2023) TaxID=3031130 RepID=A0ABT5WW88_9SPHN|nr:hypothetical protein [Novosphingobium album (ex Liu et al. 2023)]MDE8654148.1 hypothetical protein [Novosphingobium album (ex Liu et al. 2023)]